MSLAESTGGEILWCLLYGLGKGGKKIQKITAFEMSSVEDLSESTSFCYQDTCSGHTPVFWYYEKKTWLYRLQMSHDMIQLDF